MKRGRPKGYSPYVDIPYEDLADFVGRKTLVKVCGKWLKELIKETNAEEINWIAEEVCPTKDVEQQKIEYKLTTFNED